jgi:hypothetical protein
MSIAAVATLRPGVGTSEPSVMARKSGRAARGLGGVSVADLQRELARRQRAAGTLMRKRARLLKRLQSLEGQLAHLGVSGRGGVTGPVGSGRKRPHNDLSLADALAKALDGKTMSVSDLAKEVQRKGYRTTSPSFRLIVNQALLKGTAFKRVVRGQYTLK